MKEMLLEVENLHVEADGAKILKGLDLKIAPGELHVIMGPNGAGKSTLANALMSNPAYAITEGTVRFKGEDVTLWTPDTKAKAGMFLAFQYPEEISGVSVVQFLRQAISARKGIDVSALEVRFALMEWMDRLGMDPVFAERHLNAGFSGGEKKRNEILQMALLEPDLALLDETDSGLDIDALRTVADGVAEVRGERPEMGVLLITHYNRILSYLEPDFVHIAIGGKIVESGKADLALALERSGYEKWRTN
ncbi:Fe-S cluster assembly ATP-binding protein [Ferrithrix thermotolerans DSM 19514]|uniref:Fe-S cluster assembly ATP-binding protein n=1 Tax=Ferrithrix thermotolerans DSM 19514 TaxID=1121881 RepID=A0A1M4V8A9_9ACTN|nr:Fe-S cluster assembly ATPase SufC [Ferrithrix thermotolerans]SHE65162.1 Fe-S cluster assembly ATP-binding protein [Ferrithrix thermotolerans DSM 19514]